MSIPFTEAQHRLQYRKVIVMWITSHFFKIFDKSTSRLDFWEGGSILRI